MSSQKKRTFKVKSPFYDREYRVENTPLPEISRAIAHARTAIIPPLAQRQRILRDTAALITFPQMAIIETVWMTGMPIKLVTKFFCQIPQILKGIAGTTAHMLDNYERGYSEHFTRDVIALLEPSGGFCYAITPGNDPRVSALVAANLLLLGLPFIMKVSKEDRAAAYVRRALLQAGLDRKFATFITYDCEAADGFDKHAHVARASSVVWIFGSDETVENKLRYEVCEETSYLDLSEFRPGQRTSAGIARQLLGKDISRKIVKLPVRRDLFEGKTIIRHGSGNCCSIINGGWNAKTKDYLWNSVGYALGCNATKSIMTVGRDIADEVLGFLMDLEVGDPLNPNTQVGYVDPHVLDEMDSAVARNQFKIDHRGGHRLSAHQATPLLVLHRRGRIPDFLGSEIPAYVLTLQHHQTMEAAIETINSYAERDPRHAVSLVNVPRIDIQEHCSALRAHIVLLDQPTSTVIPYFHEGQYYLRALTRPKLMVTGPGVLNR